LLVGFFEMRAEFVDGVSVLVAEVENEITDTNSEERGENEVGSHRGKEKG
jgi:hypothetical protein